MSKHRPGRTNPADVLSRQPLFTNYKSTTIAEKYVNFIQNHSVPKSLTLEEIRDATLDDPELQSVTCAVKEGRWSKTGGIPSPISQSARTVNSFGKWGNSAEFTDCRSKESSYSSSFYCS